MPFTVNVIRAVDLHNTAHLGEQAVFAQVRIGAEVRDTEKRHGTHPLFGDAFMFEGPMEGRRMEIELWSPHMLGSNKLVGRGGMPLFEAELMMARALFIPLFEENGREKGQIEVSLHYVPGMAFAAAPAMMMAPQMMAPQMVQQPYVQQQQQQAYVQQPQMMGGGGMGGVGVMVGAEMAIAHDMERRNLENNIMRQEIRHDERRHEERREEVRHEERRHEEFRHEERREEHREERREEHHRR